MEKTFLTFQGKRFFYYLLIITSSFFISNFFNGCTSSKGPEIDADRQKDSLGIYTVIDKAMLQYKQTLTLNENEQTTKAKDGFEQTLTILKKVDNRVLDNPKYAVWKKDYSELAKSVVQDYLYTQTNISDKSSVFKFAKKYGVDYEVNKEVTETESADPLPDGSDVPLIRNKAVDEYIDFFSKTDRGRGFMDKSFYRSGKYFPLLRKILRYNNAPEELIYLSVQESGLNPTIVSRAGAVGLWQFMPSTGSAYGLFQDNFRDDRRDFEKSTDAAARHLKDLYRSFGDWYLAFAAYNAGPGRINNAINKSGSKDYWDIRPYLPGETKNYVPSILALSFIFRNPGEYNFKDIEYGQPITFDRVNIKGELSLEKVAEFCGSDIETIRDLNSELTADVIPNYEVPYLLRIPHGTFKTFAANYQKSSEYEKNGRNTPEFAGNEQKGFVTEVKDITYKVKNYDPGEPRYVGVSTNKKKLSYVYRGSEQLATIADSFSVRPTDIRIWNNIPFATSPKPNQELSVYLSTKMYNKFYGIKEEPVKEEQVKSSDTASTKEESLFEKIKEKKNQTETTKTKEKTNEKTSGKESEKTNKKKTTTSNYQTHTVKSGDYLSTIAEEYGVTVSDLKEWNDVTGDKIMVGQKLKIYSDGKAPETKTKEKKTKATSHTVQEGENLTLIADKYSLDVEDLMEWNDLEKDVIIPGQKLTLVKPAKDKKTADKKIKTKAKTHTVKEGENLTLIAEKYGVTLKQLRDWNDIDNDVIVPGQTLTVSAPTKDSKKNEKTEAPKTYKVKKGDTLQTVADEFGVTIKDLKKWNELDGDTIVIGQVLKVTPPAKKKK
ncbi:MAG: LysM peptidoglycan-binding domain-containing protein [Ignavibacteriae bacterium]|nr:LysM peptidoglycan-binding domain-containing protein [Ignavibacteriota bacterium]